MENPFNPRQCHTVSGFFGIRRADRGLSRFCGLQPQNLGQSPDFPRQPANLTIPQGVLPGRPQPFQGTGPFFRAIGPSWACEQTCPVRLYGAPGPAAYRNLSGSRLPEKETKSAPRSLFKAGQKARRTLDNFAGARRSRTLARAPRTLSHNIRNSVSSKAATVPDPNQQHQNQ